MTRAFCCHGFHEDNQTHVSVYHLHGVFCLNLQKLLSVDSFEIVPEMSRHAKNRFQPDRNLRCKLDFSVDELADMLSLTNPSWLQTFLWFNMQLTTTPNFSHRRTSAYTLATVSMVFKYSIPKVRFRSRPNQ